MKQLLILASALLFSSAVNAEEAVATPVAFRIEVYPRGGYTAPPPYCPPGYHYGYGRRAGPFFYGPGYYYGPQCYYYGPSYYPGPYHHYYGRRYR